MSNPQMFTKTVVFIPGFLKSCNDFDITEHNKTINITKCISKRANIHKVNLKPEDYLQPLNSMCDQIIESVNQTYPNKKIILVGHSYGCFYVLKCMELYKELIKGIILIDPTMRNNDYKQDLLSKLEVLTNPTMINITTFKLERFDELPNDFDFGSKIEMRVLLNESPNFEIKKAHFENVIKQSGTSTSKMITYNLTHMLHYKRPNDVISMIREVLDKI